MSDELVTKAREVAAAIRATPRHIVYRNENLEAKAAGLLDALAADNEAMADRLAAAERVVEAARFLNCGSWATMVGAHHTMFDAVRAYDEVSR